VVEMVSVIYFVIFSVILVSESRNEYVYVCNGCDMRWKATYIL
jgi:hypothetical protein